MGEILEGGGMWDRAVGEYPGDKAVWMGEQGGWEILETVLWVGMRLG